MVEQPLIVVRGSAVRQVPPEQAVFSAVISARDRDRDSVLTRLVERSAELRALLDGYGDAVARRETGAFQVYPELKRTSEKVVAYTGNVVTTVTVVDFGPLGEMLLKLGRLDHASVSGPWWQLRPGSSAGAEVRKMAIGDALDHAREYAAAVGARVDRLVEIADEGTAVDVGLAARGAAFGMETPAGLDLDPQQQTVQASVIVRVTITEPQLDR